MSIASQVQAKIKMIAAANGTSVTSVFDGSIENAPEIVLANNVSIVLETSSPKPWEIYYEKSPGDFVGVGSYDTPDSCFFGLSQKLMQLQSDSQMSQSVDVNKSFANVEDMTPH